MSGGKLPMAAGLCAHLDHEYQYRPLMDCEEYLGMDGSSLSSVSRCRGTCSVRIGVCSDIGCLDHIPDMMLH